MLPTALWRLYYGLRYRDIRRRRDKLFTELPENRRPSCLDCHRPLLRYGQLCGVCRRDIPQHPDYPTLYAPQYGTVETQPTQITQIQADLAARLRREAEAAD